MPGDRAHGYDVVAGMIWRPMRTASGARDEYAIEGRVDGVAQYIVCRIVIGDREIFEAWQRGASLAISRHDTAKAAREACQAHWEARNEAA